MIKSDFQKEIAFETEGVHIMELEGRDEFKCSCCGGYGNEGSSGHHKR